LKIEEKIEEKGGEGKEGVSYLHELKRSENVHASLLVLLLLSPRGVE